MIVHMACRKKKASIGVSGSLRMALHRWWHQNMGRQNAYIGHTWFICLNYGQGEIGWWWSQNPTAKNTTSRSGFSLANLTASSGEYTIRTSPPFAFYLQQAFGRTGQPGACPQKEHGITCFSLARYIASSIIPRGVTQTGQLWAMDHGYLLGQHIKNAVLHQAVGLSATDFHDCPGAGYHRTYRCYQVPNGSSIAEF